MAASEMNLPEGFELLDEQSTGLPPGFELISDQESPAQSRGASVASAGGKGLIRGTQSLTDSLHSPLDAIIKRMIGGKNTDQEIAERALPSQEGFLEDVAGRGGELLPSMLLGPGGIAGKLGRTVGAAGLGQVGEEVGGPVGGFLGELLGLSAPGLSSKIQPNKVQKPLVDFARKMGLNEKQIAPAIQSEKKTNILGKLATKGGRGERSVTESKQAVGEIYNQLKKSPQGQVVLADEAVSGLQNGLRDAMQELSSAERKYIQGDIRDLMNSRLRGEDLINFWQDLGKASRKGVKAVNALKPVVAEAIEKISPEFSQDFQLTNRLYQGGANVGSKLKASTSQKLFKWLGVGAGAYLPFIKAIGSFNYPVLAAIVGKKSASKLAEQMLVNPRLQNITRKMIDSFNSNRFTAGKRAMDQLLEMIDGFEDESVENTQQE